MKLRIRTTIGLLASFSLPVDSQTGIQKRESLKAVSSRVLLAIKAGDWDAFRKDASREILVEEQWTAYDDYFKKDHIGQKGKLGEAKHKAIAYVTPIITAKPISKLEKQLFLAYCRIVKEAWSKPTLHEATSIVSVDANLAMAPCITGTNASNLDWCVEFENINDRWFARRLFVGGH